MRRKLALFWLALSLGGAILPSATAQSGRVARPDEDPPTVLLADEVVVPVMVRDAEGRPVKGLTRDDFLVAENKVPQEISFFGTSRMPLNLLVLVDASPDVFGELERNYASADLNRTSIPIASKRGIGGIDGPIPPAIPRSPLAELAWIRKAASGLFASLGQDDRACVIQYGEKVELIQDWTANVDDLNHAVDWRYQLRGDTALWDGLYLAATEKFADLKGRKVVVLFSDGVDTKSKTKEEHVAAALDRAGIVLYVVHLGKAQIAAARRYLHDQPILSPRGRQAKQAISVLESGEYQLQRIARTTGGLLVAPTNPEDVADAVGPVIEDLRNQYVLSYIPGKPERDGQWREISVIARRPGLTIRSRAGYYAK